MFNKLTKRALNKHHARARHNEIMQFKHVVNGSLERLRENQSDHFLVLRRLANKLLQTFSSLVLIVGLLTIMKVFLTLICLGLTALNSCEADLPDYCGVDEAKLNYKAVSKAEGTLKQVHMAVR